MPSAPARALAAFSHSPSLSPRIPRTENTAAPKYRKRALSSLWCEGPARQHSTSSVRIRHLPPALLSTARSLSHTPLPVNLRRRTSPWPRHGGRGVVHRKRGTAAKERKGLCVCVKGRFFSHTLLSRFPGRSLTRAIALWNNENIAWALAGVFWGGMYFWGGQRQRFWCFRSIIHSLSPHRLINSSSVTRAPSTWPRPAATPV